MKEKIQSAVKTAFSKYGLKAENLNKIVTMIEANAAIGTVENEEEFIAGQIKVYEPMLGVFQSELDAARKPQPTPAPAPADPNPQPTPAPIPAPTDFAAALQAALAPFAEKLTGLETKLQSKEQSEQKQTLLQKVHSLMNEGGCTKEAVRKVALSEVDIDLTKTPEQIVEQVKPLYDTKFKEFYGEGAQPEFGSGGGSTGSAVEGIISEWKAEKGIVEKAKE